MGWDPTLHALDGLRLYNAIATLSPTSLLVHLSFMVWWPPVPPILMVPFYAVFGKTAAAATLLSLFSLFLVLYLPFLFFVFLEPRRVSRVDALIAYAIYLAFVVTSPLLLQYSLLVMYEIPGAALTLVACLSYWRALESPAGSFLALKRYRLAGLAILALLLTKTNYGLPLVISLFVAEIFFATREYRRQLWEVFFRPLLSPKEKWPLTVLLLPLLVLIVWIGSRGGYRGEIAGVKVSVTRIDNPVLVFFWLLALKAFLVARQRRVASALTGEHFALGRYLILPYAAWFLFPFPNRFQPLLTLTGAVNAEGSRLSLDNFLSHFRDLIAHYHVSSLELVALLVGLGVAGYFARKDRCRGAGAILFYVFFCWFSATYFITRREPRFIANFVPIFFLMAAWGYGRAIACDAKARVAAVLPLAFLLFFRDALAQPFRNHGQFADWCYKDERFIHGLRETLVPKLGGDRTATTVGLSWSGPNAMVCPALQWEMSRVSPRYTNPPTPPLCDYGYGVKAVPFLQEGLAKKRIGWVALFETPQNEASAIEVKEAKELLERQKLFLSKEPFYLPGAEARGTLYRFETQ